MITREDFEKAFAKIVRSKEVDFESSNFSPEQSQRIMQYIRTESERIMFYQKK